MVRFYRPHGELIVLAHENGLRHECSASARVVLQHTLALQWLTEGGDPAFDAVEADAERRAYDLVKELTICVSVEGHPPGILVLLSSECAGQQRVDEL